MSKGRDKWIQKHGVKRKKIAPESILQKKKKKKKELLSTWKNARFVGKKKKPWALKMGPKNTLSSNKGKADT